MIETCLDNLLSACAASLSAPPSRRYVTAGEPPADCEQLVAALVSIAEGTPGATGETGLRLGRTSRIVIVLDRCVPSGTPPAADQLDISGRALVDDAQQIWNALVSSSVCDQLQIVDVSVLRSGGVARLRFMVDVAC